jgi:hypothetical protein
MKIKMTIKMLTPDCNFHFDFHSLLIHPMFLIQPVHQPDIDKNQYDKYINRALLRNPEAQFDASDSILIKMGFPEDSTAIRDKKPDRQQRDDVCDVFLPVCLCVQLLHNDNQNENVSQSIPTSGRADQPLAGKLK